MEKKKIVVAITGASGSLYAKLFLEALVKHLVQIKCVGVVLSKNASDVWKQELNENVKIPGEFKLYERNDFFAPFASGSAKYNLMVIIPCSMGTLARIASGVSDDLITRSADVILKERRKLILVTRDTPLSLIHINNMKTVTEAGAIVCPASPSFYSNPKDINDLAKTVVNRILDLCEIDNMGYRWGTDINS